jgi:alkanesulfonate monooxygenase SsuD/methylene tetrahydromethanopterin reductase-like flavin-dependent oxidoreductase (luciferase family)
MKVWHFTEMPYPDLPDPEDYESIRITLPNGNYDPAKGADLYNRYLDEWMLADELGFDIMTNEHHQTPTCLDAACPLTLAILARQTKRARLLALGNPIANRRDPVRLAEEMAMIDVISRGRLECGFVRGVPTEILPANSHPVRMSERMWEAHDLILKAWTTHDGPFHWEGRFFNYRYVNIWPRPYQQPHPPIWITTSTSDSAMEIGRRGYVMATFLTGHETAKYLYDSYRSQALPKTVEGEGAGATDSHVAPDRFAYLALTCVGNTDELGLHGVRKIMWYLHANKIAPQFRNPPGYAPVAANVRLMRGGQIRPRNTVNDASAEELIDRGVVFAGNPESVYQQIKRFSDRVGGLGHLLIMGQGGFLSHEETVANLTLFAKEVAPRLRELPGTV